MSHTDQTIFLFVSLTAFRVSLPCFILTTCSRVRVSACVRECACQPGPRALSALSPVPSFMGWASRAPEAAEWRRSSVKGLPPSERFPRGSGAGSVSHRACCGVASISLPPCGVCMPVHNQPAPHGQPRPLACKGHLRERGPARPPALGMSSLPSWAHSAAPAPAPQTGTSMTTLFASGPMGSSGKSGITSWTISWTR